MDLNQAVLEVQRLYPMIYHACHREHRRRMDPEALTERDGAILSHLADPDLRHPRGLSAHLGVAPSTLSEALHRLARGGFVEIQRDEEDERRVQYMLTSRGREALQSTSVLDPELLGALLRGMTADERERTVQGLALIVGAAKRVTAAADAGA